MLMLVFEGTETAREAMQLPKFPKMFLSLHQSQGKKVLELGCGHGLPGIFMLMAGAEVHFQVCVPFARSRSVSVNHGVTVGPEPQQSPHHSQQ